MIERQLKICIVLPLIAVIFFALSTLAFAANDSTDVIVPVSAVCNNNTICFGQETPSNCPNDCAVVTPPPPGGGGTTYQCNDALDNDGDGLVDYPTDPGCTSLVDDTEINQPVGVPNVLNFQATYNSNTQHIDLVWQKPVGYQDFAGVRIMRWTNSNTPATPTDGLLIYDGPLEQAEDINVTPDTTYWYSAFVYNTNVPTEFSSGAIDSAYVPKPGDTATTTPPGDDPPGTPFDDLPVVDGGAAGLGDFQFIQANEPIKYFAGNQTVSVWGDKFLTVLLPYNKAPEVLKLIAVTLFDPNNNQKAFTFILRVDQGKNNYSSTIGYLADGLYPMKIHVVDYNNQVVKILDGSLSVSHRGAGFISPATIDRTKKIFLGAGIVASLVNMLVVVGGVSPLVNWYLLLLRALASLFRLLGLRKKREPWGTVYDSITKRPIDPAYVSLLQAGKEVASAITDIDGRFGFFVKPGTYAMQAGKTHYRFPSQKLAGKTEDEFFTDLYFGGDFKVTDSDVIIRNIPMDPIDFDWNEFIKTKKHFSHLHQRRELIRAYVFNGIFFIGLCLAIFEMLFNPSLINLAILALYLVLLSAQAVWVATHRLVTIKNLVTGEPMSFAIVKLYLPGSDQLIKKVVADEFGRFYILVQPGRYYLTVEAKNDDQSYTLVQKTEVLHLAKGVLTKDITIA